MKLTVVLRGDQACIDDLDNNTPFIELSFHGPAAKLSNDAKTKLAEAVRVQFGPVARGEVRR